MLSSSCSAFASSSGVGEAGSGAGEDGSGTGVSTGAGASGGAGVGEAAASLFEATRSGWGVDFELHAATSVTAASNGRRGVHIASMLLHAVQLRRGLVTLPRVSVIVVDDAIAHAESAFASLGRLHGLPAGRIDGPTLAALGAEALIVRSVTRVDAALLDAVPSLRFVGTATAGIDHLDTHALHERNIAWASAAGCNALAVAEWVLAVLTVTLDRIPGPIGIVGFGNVGSRLARLLRGLGHEVLACDPPLARAGHAEPLVGFDELWARCPIVSFHVPLILDGPDATLAYVERERPEPAGPKLLINTSRGAVLPDRALDRPDIAGMILDVWDGEPELRWSRLQDPRLLLASPHVAGYSLEAKLRATRMMHDALARAWDCTPSWTGAEHLPRRPLDGPLEGLTSRARVLERVVDLRGDDAHVRALEHEPAAGRARMFEQLRRHYHLRREFAAWTISARCPPDLRAWLERAGFAPPAA